MKISNRTLYCLFFFLSAIILAGNLIVLENSCYGIYDYGVYHQALIELSSNASWNPFLTARGTYIFNDHFDPVIIPLALFYKLTGSHLYSLMIIEWLMIFVTVFLIHRLSDIDSRSKILVSLFLIFSKGLLSAYWFPAHPTTWSIIPTLLVFYFLSKERYKSFLMSVFFLCLFKESFAFALVFIFPYLILKKKYRTAILNSLICLAFIIFELKYRRLMFGDMYGHSKIVLDEIGLSPFEYIINALSAVSIKGRLKTIYPFLIPFYIYAREIYKSKDYGLANSRVILPALLYLAPLYAIHIITGKLGYHYDIQFTSVYFSILIFSKYRQHFFGNRKLMAFTMLLFVASGMGTYTKYFNIIFKDRYSYCEISTERRDSITRVKNLVFKLPLSTKIAATGGIINSLLKPGILLYHFGGHGKRPSSYDYIIIERGTRSNVFPHNSVVLDNLVNDLRSTLQVVYEDKYFYIAKGLVQIPLLPTSINQ